MIETATRRDWVHLDWRGVEGLTPRLAIKDARDTAEEAAGPVHINDATKAQWGRGLGDRGLHALCGVRTGLRETRQLGIHIDAVRQFPSGYEDVSMCSTCLRQFAQTHGGATVGSPSRTTGDPK